MSEELLASYCTPALAGIKPSNIVSCEKTAETYQEIKKLNNHFNGIDIYMEIICECERRVLVMVYRRNVLEKHLNSSENKAFLSRYGYKNVLTLKDYIDILKSRLGKDGFPHEIGVFLGYPLYDIYCFINNKKCIFTGEWKVYHNASEAKKTFSRYRACKKAVLKKLSDGKTLAEIFRAA